MRSGYWVCTLGILLFLGTPGELQQTAGPPGQVKKQAKEASRERVWEGYLFKRRGRIQLGWPVIAMGVLAQDAHVLGKDLARKLEPFVSNVKGDYFFWNYSWIGQASKKGLPDTSVDRVPRVMVRLRGRVVRSDSGNKHRDPFDFTGSGSRTMVEGKILTLEFLPESWLRTWQELVALDFNPYWKQPEKALEKDREKIRILAGKVLAVLTRMKRISRISPETRKKVAAVDPGARAVSHYKKSMENTAHRWLVKMRLEHGLELEGLDALGSVPPRRWDLQKWFRAEKNKTAFFARVRAYFKGDLSELKMPYYHRIGNSTTLKSVTLDDVQERWTEETYDRHRAVTREIMKDGR